MRPTIHVAADGTVTYGGPVEHTGVARQFAAPFRHVKRERFRSESIPNNEYLPDPRSRFGVRRTNILAVHRADACKRPVCTNHIRGTE